MIVDGEFTFDGPREAVWALLLDPEVLSKALPGSRGLERVAEDSYEGRMNVGIGPVTAAEFTVKVSLTDLVPPESYTMVIDGKGPVGFTKGTAAVSLAEADGGRTLMTYRADLNVGGKIAGVGQRLLDSVSKAMTRQGLEALNKELQARLDAAGRGAGAATGEAEADAAPGGSPLAVPGGGRLRRRAIQSAAVILLLISLLFMCGLPGGAR